MLPMRRIATQAKHGSPVDSAYLAEWFVSNLLVVVWGSQANATPPHVGPTNRGAAQTQSAHGDVRRSLERARLVIHVLGCLSGNLIHRRMCCFAT